MRKRDRLIHSAGCFPPVHWLRLLYIHNGRMNHTFMSGLATATLLITTLGISPYSSANQSGKPDETSEADVPVVSTTPITAASPSATPNPTETTVATAQTPEAVKVGEYQSQETREPQSAIATIYAHDLEGKQAATVYIRNIPVLTFLGSTTANSSPSSNSVSRNPASTKVKVASMQNRAEQTEPEMSSVSEMPHSADKASSPNAEASANPNDPVWRATTIAARLNQLYRENLDASSITASWNDQQQRYEIKAGDEELLEIDNTTILPDTTNSPSEDTLQAVNRIRRQVGNAPPLDGISGDPQARTSQFSFGSIQLALSGLASWYGPGFDGARSASGEVFNQNALTAAHPSLPFGTQVRVTNLDNGMSVVVRINDRGPYAHDRVIDLSAGAARIIGLMQAGVAPVNLQVVSTLTASGSR